MKISSVEFVISSTQVAECPKHNFPEYAFIGRSNVGKSSLINMLMQRKDLAKTSGKPGKTQLINHFKVNRNWFLVDLPGYGYAQVSKKKRAEFKSFIRAYFKERQQLVCAFVLVDSRLVLQQADLDFMRFLTESQVAFCIVFTKVDKLNRTQLSKQIANYKAEMLKFWEELPIIFTTSAQNSTGRDEFLTFVEQLNQEMVNSLS